MFFIWWRGRGLWAMLILMVSLSLGVGIALVAIEAFPSWSPSAILCAGLNAGMIGGGILCWVLGRSWNSRLPAGSHSLYSIPVEYWGVIAWLFSGISTFKYFLQ